MIGITNDISVRAPELHAREVVGQITRALHRHANLEASNIHVSVANGKVKLEGTIPTYPERDLVEEAVWATGGVKEIEDRLSGSWVCLAGKRRAPAARIRCALRTAIWSVT